MNKKKRINILEHQVSFLLLKLIDHNEQIQLLQKEQNLPFGPIPIFEPIIPDSEFKISKAEIKRIKDSLDDIKLPKKKRKKSNEPDFDIIPPPPV